MTEATYPQSPLSREIDAREPRTRKRWLGKHQAAAREENWQRRQDSGYIEGDGAAAVQRFRDLPARDIIDPLCVLISEVLHPRPRQSRARACRQCLHQCRLFHEGFCSRDCRDAFLRELALLAQRQPAGWVRDVLAKWPAPVPRPEPVVVGTGNETAVTGGLVEVEPEEVPEEKTPRFPSPARRPALTPPKPRKVPTLELHWQPHDAALCSAEIETFGGTGDEPVILWAQCGNPPVRGDSYCAAHRRKRHSEVSP